jgi:protein-S-isoprenylcysteine O-methyltransferase Ste14
VSLPAQPYASVVRAPRSMPNLGSRGQGWVALQGVLLVAVAVAAALTEWRPPPAVGAAGLALMVAGVVLCALGLRGLASHGSLTAFPRPLDVGRATERGVYGHARHPIYGGLLLAVAGLALLRPWAFVPGALLALLFWAKSEREEAWLLDRYPGYAAYRVRVRRRFVPYLI